MSYNAVVAGSHPQHLVWEQEGHTESSFKALACFKGKLVSFIFKFKHILSVPANILNNFKPNLMLL